MVIENYLFYTQSIQSRHFPDDLTNRAPYDPQQLCRFSTGCHRSLTSRASHQTVTEARCSWHQLATPRQQVAHGAAPPPPDPVLKGSHQCQQPAASSAITVAGCRSPPRAPISESRRRQVGEAEGSADRADSRRARGSVERGLASSGVPSPLGRGLSAVGDGRSILVASQRRTRRK